MPVSGPLTAVDAIAELTDLVLSAATTEQFCAEAARLMADVLRTDGSCVMELIGDDRLLFRAIHGWSAAVGSDLIPMAPDSQAAFVIAAPDAVLTPDQTADERFVPSGLMMSAGFACSLSCRIGPASEPLGLLGVYHRTARGFSDSEIAHLRAISCLVAAGIDRRRRRADLEFRATHDALTGLANRAALFEALERLVDGNGAPPGVVLLDLDGFKPINDRHGHAVGDRALRVVADRLRDVVRPNDLVARLSGDEFVLVCPGLDRPGATRFAERLIGRLERVMVVDGKSLSLSASVGIGLSEGQTTATDLLRAADGAMYRAKAAGRGQVMLSQPGVAPDEREPHAEGRRPVRVGVDELRAVIDGAYAVFQPIVRASDKAIVAVEALARGPVGSGLEQPDDLFGVAETHGRVPELELAVKRSAFEADLPEGLPLFFNCDPAVLAQPEWLDRLVRAWEEVARRRPLIVELTERSLTASPRRLLAGVERCRRLGWLIALDDIGARAESLTVLRIVKPDVVKLDLSLTAQPSTPHAAAVATAVAGFKERSPVHVIAEGVENVEHELAAGVLGASYLQGYRFGRPARAGELDLGDLLLDGPSPLGGRRRMIDPGEGEPTATKSQLLGLSRHIESISWTADTVVLASVQRAHHYTPRTRQQYAALARQCGFVGVLGEDLTPGVFQGVRHAAFRRADPLLSCWQVVSLSVTGGVALIAEEIGPPDLPDPDRLFRYIVTSVPAEVEAAASRLLRYF